MKNKNNEIELFIKGDYSHCCPHGYTCDVEHNKCEKGISIPWFKKKAAIPISESLSKLTFSTIQCPGLFFLLFFRERKKSIFLNLKMKNHFVLKKQLVVN
jgi:hypothetical protein